MAETGLPVQNRLNLVLPIRPDRVQELKNLLGGLGSAPQNPLASALERLGNVHFAQFVFLENDTRLGVFTIYDGDFDAYILSFTEHVGQIFNAVLQNVVGGEELVPVQAHRDAFVEFIHRHDHAGIGRFDAYPNRRRFDIVDALQEAGR